VLHLRISTVSDLTTDVVEALSGDPAVNGLAVLEGASVRPAGDLVLADVAPRGRQ